MKKFWVILAVWALLLGNISLAMADTGCLLKSSKTYVACYGMPCNTDIGPTGACTVYHSVSDYYSCLAVSGDASTCAGMWPDTAPAAAKQQAAQQNNQAAVGHEIDNCNDVLNKNSAINMAAAVPECQSACTQYASNPQMAAVCGKINGSAAPAGQCTDNPAAGPACSCPTNSGGNQNGNKAWQPTDADVKNKTHPPTACLYNQCQVNKDGKSVNESKNPCICSDNKTPAVAVGADYPDNCTNASTDPSALCNLTGHQNDAQCTKPGSGNPGTGGSPAAAPADGSPSGGAPAGGGAAPAADGGAGGADPSGGGMGGMGSMMMPLMMMGMMAPMMMMPLMSLLPTLLSSLQNNNSNGTSNCTSGTGNTATNSGATSGTCSSGTTGTTGTRGTTGTTATTGSTSSGPLSSLETAVTNLVGGGSTTAGSDTATGATTPVQQEQSQLEDAGNTSDAATTPAAAVDPTQDYHGSANQVDRRLSCAWATGGSVANCRTGVAATPATSQ